VSSSLIFLFQNKSGLSDKQFEEEVSAYENNFLLKNLEEEKKIQLNLKVEKSNEGIEKHLIESRNQENVDETNFDGDYEKDKNMKDKEDIKKKSEQKRIDIVKGIFTESYKKYDNHKNCYFVKTEGSKHKKFIKEKY